MQFYAFVLNQFSSTIKVLQSDREREYMSTAFQTFLAQKGIIHHRSCSYTPEQNGLAERKNRHLIETAITLLRRASLHEKFWTHACAIAAYLINRMPCPKQSFKSPFELLYGKAPSLEHLRIFGCACYPNLKPYMTHKLQSKT